MRHEVNICLKCGGSNAHHYEAIVCAKQIITTGASRLEATSRCCSNYYSGRRRSKVK